MAPLNVMSLGERAWRAPRGIVARYFFICEGSRTEKWYFTALFNHLARKQLPVRIDPQFVERTEEDETNSAPQRLVNYAEEIRKGGYGFDPTLDKTVVVFDVDVFKRKDPEVYDDFIREAEADNILAVTNPSIELFLVLHAENGHALYVQPHEAELLANAKAGKGRRYADKLCAEVHGVNPKKNESIGDIAFRYETAIAEEKHVNNDVSKALSALTSNIGCVIEGMLRR